MNALVWPKGSLQGGYHPECRQLLNLSITAQDLLKQQGIEELLGVLWPTLNRLSNMFMGSLLINIH